MYITITFLKILSRACVFKNEKEKYIKWNIFIDNRLNFFSIIDILFNMNDEYINFQNIVNNFSYFEQIDEILKSNYFFLTITYYLFYN